MTTTTAPASTAIAVTEPVFSTQERLALAGFLAGYTGLTREAYTLDLHQFFLTPDGRRLDRHGAARIVRRVAGRARDQQDRRAAHAPPCIHHRSPRCGRPLARRPRSRLPRRPEDHDPL